MTDFARTDMLSEAFGGYCKDTGEPMVDLNAIDSSFEGTATVSEAAALFAGKAKDEPNPADGAVS